MMISIEFGMFISNQLDIMITFFELDLTLAQNSTLIIFGLPALNIVSIIESLLSIKSFESIISTLSERKFCKKFAADSLKVPHIP